MQLVTSHLHQGMAGFGELSIEDASEVAKIAPKLEERFGDLPLSALGRCAEIEEALARIRSTVEQSVFHIAERMKGRRWKKPLSSRELAERAACVGDAEAMYILDYAAEFVSRYDTWLPDTKPMAEVPAAVDPHGPRFHVRIEGSDEEFEGMLTDEMAPM